MPPDRPLNPRWEEWDVPTARAGTITAARVVIANDGTATWRSAGSEGLQVAYHWLDPLGNPIVWDGVRTPLPQPVAPGSKVTVELPIHAPRAPGRYRLTVDLVEEHRFWLEEIGCKPLTTEIVVAPRIGTRRLRVVVLGGADDLTEAALAAQDEAIVDGAADAIAYLTTGAAPDPTWARRVLDAHAEGFEAVGVGLVPHAGRRPGHKRSRNELAAWAPGSRNPRFGLPLLLPSLLTGLEPSEHLGYPAYLGGDGLFEGRASIRLPTRSGRQRG